MQEPTLRHTILFYQLVLKSSKLYSTLAQHLVHYNKALNLLGGRRGLVYFGVSRFVYYVDEKLEDLVE